MKQKIFLTGSTGFIGHNIVEKLGDKYIFFSPNRQELDLLDECAVYDYLKNNSVDVVIHAANVGGKRNLSHTDNILQINLKMFFNLIKAKNFYKKIIVLGSGAEYDKKKEIKNVVEDDFDKIIPTDSYGFYKYIISKFVQNTDYIINLRLFGVYGKYEDYKVRFISNVICKVLLDIPITINQNVYFDYLHINDFCSILDYFIKHDKLQYKIYNVGRGEKIDLVTIAKKILSILGKENTPIIIKKDGLNLEYTANVERLKKEMKDFKYTDFDESLVELIEYYKTIIHTLDKKDFLYE